MTTKFSKLNWNREPQGSGFTTKIKSVDDRKLPSIYFFYNNMENVQAKLALLSVQKARTSFYCLYSYRQ